MHRAPQPGEGAGWQAALAEGRGPSDVARGFLESVEYRTNQIRDAYWTLLGRAPQESEVAGWLARTALALTTEEVTAGFLASAEYFRLQGGNTAAWLAGIYRDVLGRLPDQQGAAYWTDRLESGATPEQIAGALVRSHEAHALGVEKAYRALLRREPEPAGSTFWVGAMDTGATATQLLAAIAASAEYAKRDDVQALPTGDFRFQLQPGMEGALSQLEPLLSAGHATVKPTNLPGLYETRAHGDDSVWLAATLAARPYVRYVERPQSVRVADTIPNEFLFQSGSLYGLGMGPGGLQGPAAWDITTGSTDVTVAVIDTGVDYDHIDLYKNIWINQGEIPGNRLVNLADLDGDGRITFWDLNDPINQGPGKITDLNGDGRISGSDILTSEALGGWANGIADDGDNYVDDLVGWNFVSGNNMPLDDNSHGTHVAGTIGAIGNNGILVVGVAWKTQLMVAKFIAGNGNGDDLDGARAIRYAVDHGARVSNNSWGGSYSDVVHDAIQYAGTREHVFVAAAGNSSVNTDQSPLYPAADSLPNIISVTATNQLGNITSFSNYGPTTVDLGAAGVDIVSTIPGSSYQSAAGSSTAAPHVAGTVALVQGEQPGWSATRIVDWVLSKTTPNPNLAGLMVTEGIVNAAKAVTPSSEVQVLDGTTNILDGRGSVAFGTTLIGTPRTKTFTIRNIGSLDLDLTGTVSAPFGFSVIANPGLTTLAPGEETSFTLRLDAIAIGAFSGQVSFATTDSDENPFNFAVTGTVTGALYGNDAGQGFVATAGWVSYNQAGYGYGSDIHYAATGSGADVATWTLVVAPGRYRISATWPASPNRATDAPFTVFDGATGLGTVRINQQLDPADFLDAGFGWRDLGSFTVFSNSLVIRLTNSANGYVIADAVRAELLGAPAQGPEIQVFDGGSELTDGISSVAFGSTQVGVPVTKAFNVRNAGAQTLVLSGTINVPTGFSVAAGFGLTTLPPGAATTFAIRFDAGTSGSSAGTVSFNTNDADENPFDFGVNGSASSVRFVDDGDAGFSTAGSWAVYLQTGYGYGSDVRYAPPGGGSDVATWALAVTPGRYRVSATWPAASNRATNAPYTLLDGTTVLGTVRLNQQMMPTDFSDGGATWKDLGTIAVSGNTLVVRLANDANGYVIADAVRVERLGALPQGPEIEVFDGATLISDGSGVAAFGGTQVGVPLTKTFTIRNAGTQNLLLSGPITVPAGFSVVSGFGATTVTPGAATTFSVRLDAAATGSYSGTLSFGTNDADENPFDFTVTGSASQVRILDDGDAGFSIVGAWTAYNQAGYGYGSDVRYAAAGSGAVATWLFGVPPGQYRVAVTYPAESNRATNAPYTVKDGTVALRTARVNQQLAPADFSDSGTGWKDLGNFTIFGTSLSLELANDANGYVIADAVRVERIGAVPQGPEIEVLDGTTSISDGTGTVAFGGTQVGVPITKTFTIRNAGTQDLLLSGPITLPAGFSVAAAFGATTVTPGSATTFSVRLEAATTGSYSGTLSFGTNDADENPFDFMVTGSASQVQILDDGDAGFSTVGAWTAYNQAGYGYGSDVRYAAAGSGAVATWLFNVPAGQYRVAVTYPAEPNRATNAPLTVKDGATVLGTLRVNQQLAPADFSDFGAGWKDLGSFTVHGTSLGLELENNANGYVIADAVRVERIGALPQGPEIQVVDGATELVDGASTVAFTSAQVGVPVTKIFTIRNIGTQALSLNGPITVPAGFRVSAGFGTTTLAPGSATTFALQLDAAAPGNYSGPVSFGNNDSDENPFDFAVAGSVSAVQVLDDGDAGFTATAGWVVYLQAGYGSDIHYAAAGNGSEEASWTFAVAPGRYRVSATWPPAPNRATDAPYTIHDGTTPRGTVPINQQQSPADLSYGGTMWKDLGTFTLTGSALVVKLANNANGYVIADAVRIEWLGP